MGEESTRRERILGLGEAKVEEVTGSEGKKELYW